MTSSELLTFSSCIHLPSLVPQSYTFSFLNIPIFTLSKSYSSLSGYHLVLIFRKQRIEQREPIAKSPNGIAKNFLFFSPFTALPFPYPHTIPLLPNKNSLLLLMPCFLYLERLCLSSVCSNLPSFSRQPNSHLLHDLPLAT